MTDDDVLARATRALKERDATPSPAPTMATRLAILDASDQDRRQGRRNRFLIMPIAATLVLIATWAAASGTLARVFASDVPAESAPAPTRVAATSSLSAESTESPAAPTGDPRTVTEPPAAPANATAPSHAVTEPPAAPATPTAPPRAVTEPPAAPATATIGSVAEATRVDALYATAHRLHFDARDHDGALRAWDAYLEAAPAGRLAPEARYNRGLCLVHLGRAADARAALAPIAAGAPGSSRQDEAARLLRALDGAAP